MTDRTISVRLRIEVEQARRDQKAAAQGFVDIANAAERAGNSGQAMGKLASAAKATGLAVAGIGTVALGGMTALTASTVKTGLSYNTLEQTSRAALKTVLGSAGAASRQMEQLREFGKTSPFPRQVWISAQQQLLAFGMSAEKIIPTFKSVQDAVAAAGGGGQQISEVVDVLAKVQSTGKVTAETLNELGYRGIDAATLIGQAMGKTAAEVREDISNQAITGVQFIDQLTAAMAARFGGAAANVKMTWTGAVDRVKGALRDIGGILASPFIDPNGGGALVEWANGVADALRALEGRLEPVIAAFRQRAEPAFQAISDKLQDLAKWIKTADFSQIREQIQAVLPAVAGITAGFATMGAKSLPVIGNMVSGLKPLPVAIAAAALASPELRGALLDLISAMTPLLEIAAQGAQLLAGLLGPAFTVVAALLQPVIAVVGVFADVLDLLPGPVKAVIGALVLFKGLQLTGTLSGFTAAFQRFGQEMALQKQYASMAGQSIGSVNAAYSVAAAGVSRAATGMKGALAGVAGFLTGPWGVALAAGATLLLAFASSSDAGAQKQTGLIDALEAGTGAITKNTQAWVLNQLETDGVNDMYRQIGGDANDLTDALLGNADAADRVRAKLKGALAGATGQEKLRLQALLALLDQMPGALGKAQGAARDKAKADEDGADAANDNANANAGLTGALGGVAGAAADAAMVLQQMKADLQALYESQFALEESQDKFQGGFHKLRSMFEGNSKATTKSAAASDKYSDSLKRQAKIVEDTKKQLRDLAEAQRKAEQEAREAAQAAKQRRLDELFGRQFDVQATRDAFRASLAQAGSDIAGARKDRTAGATSLAGFSEGALANRDRLRNLVQQAQASIQAEIDRGASKGRISAVTKDLSTQLAAQARSWGLNAQQVKVYTDAIRQFGGVANKDVKPNLAAVRKEYAEQRAEIKANSREQIESAKQSARTAVAQSGATAAAKIHTAALKGNSESAIENRHWFREQVKAAQEELIQMKANGAGKEAITKRGKELALQLQREGRQMGFTERDMREYTGAVKDSAVVVNHYPALNIRVKSRAALATLANFQRGVDRIMGRIKKRYQLGLTTTVPGTTRFLPGMSHTGGHVIAAEGGFIRGPGGPKGDKIPAMLSDTEFVQQASAVKYYGVPFMNALNQRQIPKDAVPQFAGGGPVTLTAKTTMAGGMGRALQGMRRAFTDALFGLSGVVGGGRALQWAASQAGKPYIWGGVGPRGYDCSGFQSAILNVIQGRNPYSRRFATGSFPTGDFARGPGRYMIGSFRGNPGHMAGTLNGVNVESRGGEGVVVGRRARGAGDGLFGGNIWHLRGYAKGGVVKGGDAPFDLMDPRGRHFEEFMRMRGSYRRGTDFVPMDGMYQLHRGEQVVPAQRNQQPPMVLEVRGDGSKASDFVIDSLNRGIGTGRIRLVQR